MKFLLRERLKSVSAIESRYGSSLRPLHPIAAVNVSASMPYVIAVVAISGSFVGEGGFHVRRHPSGQGKDWHGRRAGPQDQGGRHSDHQ
jgi:hypothetical protein